MRKIVCRNAADFNKIKEKYPEISGGCVAVLGFFDGVHTAHRALIGEGRAEADFLKLPLVVFTFFGCGDGPKKIRGLIYSDDEKISLLSECGADATVICEFNAVSEMSGEEFVDRILINALFTRVAVCGFNFRFGKGASTSSDDLSRLMSLRGRKALIIPELTYGNETVSSTRIRNLLSSADMESAAKLLGTPYFISGKVTHGNGKGRDMGTPTVNTELEAHLFSPPNGVYLTAAKVRDKLLPAVTNVGICPTFDKRDVHAETYILDFDGNLYGDEIKIYFLAFIRDERTFCSEKELKKQINVDITKAKKLLKEIKWQEIGLSLQ